MEIMESNYKFKARRYLLDNRFHQTNNTLSRQLSRDETPSPPPDTDMRTTSPSVTTRDMHPTSHISWERKGDDYMHSESNEIFDKHAEITNMPIKHSSPNSPLTIENETEENLSKPTPLPKPSPQQALLNQNNNNQHRRNSLSPSTSEYSFSIKHILQMTEEKCSTDQQHRYIDSNNHRPNRQTTSSPSRPSRDPSMVVTCLPSPNENEERFHKQHHHHSYPFHVSQAFAESAYFNNSTCRTIGCRKCHNNNELLSSLSSAMHSGKRYQSPPLPLHAHHQTHHLDHVLPMNFNHKGENINLRVLSRTILPYLMRNSLQTY